jgi:hypothetical protein
VQIFQGRFLELGCEARHTYGFSPIARYRTTKTCPSSLVDCESSNSVFTGGRSRTGDPPCGGTNSTTLRLPSATLLLKSVVPDGVCGIRCIPESPSICGAHTGADCSLPACRRLASYSRRSKRSACRMVRDTEDTYPLNCLTTSMVWLQVKKRWAARSEQ